VPPLQLHRGLNRLDPLVPGSNGYMECGLKTLIGFDQFCVLIRHGNRRRLYQLASLLVTVTTHRLEYSHAFRQSVHRGSSSSRPGMVKRMAGRKVKATHSRLTKSYARSKR
jgi:hypothetical protein